MKSADELIGCQYGCLSSRLIPGQFIARHAGRGIQKSHIVVIDFDLVFNAVQKAVNLDFAGFFIDVFPGILVGQPDLARPESRRPVHIVRRRVKPVLAVSLLELRRELRQIALYLRRGEIHRLSDLLLCDLRFFFVSHTLLLLFRFQIMLCLSNTLFL